MTMQNNIIGVFNNRLLKLVCDLDQNIAENEAAQALICLLLYRVDIGNSLIQLEKKSVEMYFDEVHMPMPEKLREASDDDAEKQAWIAERDAWMALCLEGVKSKLFEKLDCPLFVLEDGSLYVRKYYDAKKSICERMNVLFGASYNEGLNAEPYAYADEQQKYPLDEFQMEAARKGIKKNLLITGGPGTGKTTVVSSIIKTLEGSSLKQYYTAPSGKAAKNLHPDGETIHTLLRFNLGKGSFTYGKDNPLPTGIFVIDEASMIDAVMFASLLEAIPDDARVFILGDKDQLPSVGVGAVFADLLESYKDNRVDLKVTHRFAKEIKDVATAVNEGGDNIRLEEIGKYSHEKPIALYPNFDSEKFAEEWVKENYKKSDVQSVADFKESWTTFREAEPWKGMELLRKGDFPEQFELCCKAWEVAVDSAKILCCENHGKRGVSTLNELVRKQLIKAGVHHFDVKMITQNTKELNLKNGDTGMVIGRDVFFKQMEKRRDEQGNVYDNTIFRVIPLGSIDASCIVNSFAMTVHKSQGSGYVNVALVLPENKNHPLLTRQILYTAITRTKNKSKDVGGTCVILSDLETLKHGSQKVEVRETGLC